MKHLIPIAVLFLLFAANACNRQINTNISAENSTPAEGLNPIDIKAPKFFWLIQPWKEGKLATIDGWGRFAEISFEGADKIKITPLVEFPKTSLDRTLITWPEAGLIASTTGKMHHLAAIDDKKTKSHVPLLSWVHKEMEPVLLDPNKGLVSYCYWLDRDRNDVNTKLFIYNYKEDKIIYESPDDFNLTLRIAMNEDYVLGNQRIFDSERQSNRCFYNWRTNEITSNNLTDVLNQHECVLFISPDRNIHPGKRVFLISVKH